MKKIPLLAALETSFPGAEKDLLYSWILCGEIQVNGETCRDPKAKVNRDSALLRRPPGFVSRGGEKLFPVLTELMAEFPDLDPRGKWILDAGSSTGGFVDVVLSLGASGVYAVDVGTNQLHYRLRVDPRVKVWENTNILGIRPENLDPRPSFCTADLSFRSILGVGSLLVDFATSGLALVLVKPQFETDFHTTEHSFSGVVGEEEAENVVFRVVGALKAQGLQNLAIRPAGLKGAKGNQEYFVLLSRVGA